MKLSPKIDIRIDNDICILLKIEFETAEEEKDFKAILGFTPSKLDPLEVFPAVAKQLWETQREFYKALMGSSFRICPDYHSPCSAFSFECAGFQTFLRQAKPDTQSIERLLITNLSILLRKKVPLFFPLSQKLITGFSIENGVFSLNDQAYDFDFDSAVASLQEQMESAYAGVLRFKTKVLEKEIKKLREQLEMANEEAGKRLTSLVKQAEAFGWEITLKGFLYPHKIKVKRVISRGKLYFAPRGYFVKGLLVPWDYPLEPLSAQESHHPNLSGNSNGTIEVCAGDLEGKPILDLLADLPKLLETANCDSAFPRSSAAQILMEHFQGEKPPLKPVKETTVWDTEKP